MNKMSKYFIPLLIIGIGFGELNDELTTVINSGDYIEAKLFIDNGFDINEKSAEGNTYLSLALALCTLLSQQMGNPIVKGVIDNDSHEFTIDCQQAVEVICKLGGDVNMPIVIGNKKISTSALALAVGIGDIEIIKTLLFYKANPDIGMSGPSITVSPLMLVMLNDNKKMIQS